MTPAESLRAKSLEGLRAALEAEIKDELLGRRPALLAAADQAESAAQDAKDRHALADGITRALRDELLAARQDMAQVTAGLDSPDRTTRIDAQVEAPAVERDIERIQGKLAAARADADGALAEKARTRADADAALLDLALLDLAMNDPAGSLLGKQSEAWEREFRERGWLATMRAVQRGEDLQKYDMLRMMGVLKDVVIQSGFKEMFVLEGVERAKHGPLQPASVEMGQDVADAATARLRGQLTDGRTQGRTGDVSDYSPDRPRGGA